MSSSIGGRTDVVVVCVRVGRRDEVAEATWWPPPLGRGEEEVRVAVFAVPSAPRRLASSGEVVTRTDVATSGDTGVAVTSTCSAGATVGTTPLAPISAEGLSEAVVVTGGTDSEAKSESFGSGRDWRFD